MPIDVRRPGDAIDEPEMVLVPLDDLREALSDLATYIAQEWQYRDIYPSQRRKYDRDMQVVIRLLKVIDGRSTNDA